MPLQNSSERALRVFYSAHQFLREHDIHWLPVNPEDIIIQHRNWKLKYVHQVAYEIGKDEQYVLDHVMRSQDGLSMYDVKVDKYDILINASDEYQKESENEPCGNRQTADTAFCEQCGRPVFRIRQGFCFEECEI